MDPITAFLAFATALTNFATAAAAGQTPEQRKIIWDWYIQDVTWLRKALKIDKDTP